MTEDEVTEVEADAIPTFALDQWMEQDLELRQLRRALELQDEAERAAQQQHDDDDDNSNGDDYCSENDVASRHMKDHMNGTTNHAHNRLLPDQKAEQKPDIDVSALHPPPPSILFYECFLKRQRYYDDLKHVDYRYIEYRIPTPAATTAGADPSLQAGSWSSFVPLLIEQDKSLGKGGICWDAAFILGEFLSRHLYQGFVCDDVSQEQSKSDNYNADCRIIELGCGTGVCGMMIAKSLAPLQLRQRRRVTMFLTDLDELQPLLCRNVQRNFSHSSHYETDPEPLFDAKSTSSSSLDGYRMDPNNSSADDGYGACVAVIPGVLRWGCTTSLARRAGTCDILIGADIVATIYDEIALADTIHVLAHTKTTVYISYRERHSEIQSRFVQAMRSRFEHLHVLDPSTTALSRNCNPEVRIMVVSGKRSTVVLE